MTDPLEGFLRRRFPDLDLRVTREGNAIVVRYAAPAAKGRRFPVLFTLRREGDAWTADRPFERGVIGETLEFLRWLEKGGRPRPPGAA